MDNCLRKNKDFIFISDEKYTAQKEICTENKLESSLFVQKIKKEMSNFSCIIKNNQNFKFKVEFIFIVAMSNSLLKMYHHHGQ